MFRSLTCFFLIIGALLVGFGSLSRAEDTTSPLRTFSLPTDPFAFQSGKGQEIANTYCIICHSADYIYMQPKHSEKKWTAIIHKMKKTFGCPIPQEQVPTLATYLFQQYSVKPLPLKDSR